MLSGVGNRVVVVEGARLEATLNGRRTSQTDRGQENEIGQEKHEDRETQEPERAVE